jgi:hypothetical protein
MLPRLYPIGSLEREGGGLRSSITSRPFDATLGGVDHLAVDRLPIALDRVHLDVGGRRYEARDLGDGLVFPLRAELTVHVEGLVLAERHHDLEVAFDADPFGALAFAAADVLTGTPTHAPVVPRDEVDAYRHEAVTARVRMLTERTGVEPPHLSA